MNKFNDLKEMPQHLMRHSRIIKEIEKEGAFIKLKDIK